MSNFLSLPLNGAVLTTPDTHEGAEGPLVGAVAAFGGLMASIGTDTTELLHRLRKRPRHVDVETLQRSVSNDEPDDIDLTKGITSRQFHHLAYRMAVKSYEDDPNQNFSKPRNRPGITAIRTRVAAKKVKGGRGYQITSATTHYACDLATTAAKGELLQLRRVYLLMVSNSSGCPLLQRSERLPKPAVLHHSQ